MNIEEMGANYEMNDKYEMVITNAPITLYHYTNLDTLKAILRNKTIRFNSLNNLDDLDESSIKSDGTKIVEKCYVSSWTDKPESIPFWHGYARGEKGLERGVMISLPVFPFSKEKISIEKNEEDSADGYKGYIPQLVYKDENNKYLISLLRIVYTDDEYLLKDIQSTIPLYRKDDSIGMISGQSGQLAMYKRKCWEYQSEWRYRIINISGNINTTVDIPIYENALKKMTVTISPFFSDEYLEELEEIRTNYEFISVYKSKIRVK